MKHRLPAAIVALALVGTALTACTKASNTMDGVQVVTPGTLTVCTNPPYKPMEFLDNSGNVVGMDMDLVQLVADKMGAKMAVVQADFDQITSGALMAAKKCDLGASSITITEARKQAVDFSVPYFKATQALAVKGNSGIAGLADLSGKKLAVQDATTGADYANAHAQEYGYTVVTFEDSGLALNAVLAGTSDAALIDNAPVHSFVQDNPSMAVATEFQTGELYGMVAPNDANGQALIDVVNQVLSTANTDGTYLKLYQKWIDPTSTTAALPTAADATAAPESSSTPTN